MHFKYRFIHLSISIIRLVLYGIKKVTRSHKDQKNSAPTNCYPLKSNLQTFRSYKTASYTVTFMVPQSIIYCQFACHWGHHFKHQTLHCMHMNDLTEHRSCHQGAFPTTPSDEIVYNSESPNIHSKCQVTLSVVKPSATSCRIYNQEDVDCWRSEEITMNTNNPRLSGFLYDYYSL